MDGTTIPHAIERPVRHRSTVVACCRAEEGAGVIAGGGARAVLELAGVKDIRTKTYGTNNPHQLPSRPPSTGWLKASAHAEDRWPSCAARPLRRHHLD